MADQPEALVEPLFGARQITLFLKNTSEVAESGRAPRLSPTH